MLKSLIYVPVVVTLLATPNSVLFSQKIQFQRHYGEGLETGNSVQQTSDGGYIIAGSSAGLYLIKTTPSGDTLWTRTYGGASRGYSVRQTFDNGYIVAGSSAEFGYLIRTSPSGDTLWTRTFSRGISLGLWDVQQTSDGGYITVGTTHATVGDPSNVYLIRTSPSGDTLWTRTFKSGGDYGDTGNSVQQTSEGGYIIAGAIDASDVRFDVFLIKTNPSGDTLWTRRYPGYGHSVQQTGDGGYIISGTYLWFGLPVGAILIKTNSVGDTLWTRTYRTRDGYGSGRSVQQTSDSGYILVGTAGPRFAPSDVCLFKTNSSGDTLWTRTYGDTSSDWGNSVRQTTDGGYIIAGTTNSFGSPPSYVYLIKTQADGTVGVRNLGTDDMPTRFRLEQNYPNPFNPSTTILYSLPVRSHVVLKVYSIIGEEVATLADETQEAGFKSVVVDAGNLASGVYFYKLMSGGFVEIRRMLLIR